MRPAAVDRTPVRAPSDVVRLGSAAALGVAAGAAAGWFGGGVGGLFGWGPGA